MLKYGNCIIILDIITSLIYKKEVIIEVQSGSTDYSALMYMD